MGMCVPGDVADGVRSCNLENLLITTVHLNVTVCVCECVNYVEIRLNGA